ncbi:hypothetical protein D7V93_38295 [Corallococcus llansteffanensis]|uniref:Uncharacterized protein n=2 Tax=Corallococcus llansteffanensis TaxID=2316731 RepID=A0A3A8NE97_9BACT|nr:hypothetical protein D7V93_38295 [Corallococcus llansteffanensis]
MTPHPGARYIGAMSSASLFAVVASLGLVACSPASFTTEIQGETTVPAHASGVPTLLNAFPAISSFAALDFNQNQDFRNRDVTKDEVSRVQVKSLSLKVLSPNDQGFDFLDSLEAVARAGDQEVRFAGRDGIARLELGPPNPTLSLKADGDMDLRPYVAAPTMAIILRGNGRLPEKEVRLQATVVLEVEGGLL